MSGDRDMATTLGRQMLLGVALLLVVGCEEASERQAAIPADADWQAVQAYLDRDTAWHRDKSKDKGPHPSIENAVAAARRIIAAASHPKLAASAEFLIEHPAGLSETAADDMALGLRTLIAHVGADWTTVESYRQHHAEWSRQLADAADSSQRDTLMDQRPGPLQALAAAAAIAELDGHQRRQEAAVFLVENSSRRLPDKLAATGVKTLLDHFPQYDGWQELFDSGDVANLGSELLDAIASRVSGPLLMATARYHLAASLIDDANSWTTTDEARQQLRSRARDAVEGLSGSVGDKEFEHQRRGDDGTQPAGTFADAEADLLFRLDHATAGGTLPEATGNRLDGEQESLSAYAGKVVLVDFWATWCAPCIRALPKLRQLHRELAADRFALLAISVDDELETVTSFMAEEPMPWANWHVGSESAVGRAWNVTAFPTYILVDGQGTILARTSQLDDRLISLAENAVADADAT